MSESTETPMPTPHMLHRCLSGEVLRPATYEERCRAEQNRQNNGILGVILVDGTDCYVEDGNGYADPACEERAWEDYHADCTAWGETAAEVGSGHYLATRDQADALFVGQEAAGRIPKPQDYGVTPCPPSPTVDLDMEDHHVFF